MAIRFTGNKPEMEVFQVFNKTMRDLIETDPRVVYLDADLMGALKTQELWKDFPENVFNVGIQEADMIGVACGMYLNGFKPFVHSFAPFVSRRVFDQLYLSVAYGGKSVRVIGSEPGIMATHNGGTHMCFEDIAMMMTVPGACIIDVSDPTMLGYLMKHTVDRPGLTYFRMPRRDLVDIYTADTTFEEGKAKILKEGSDVTLIGSGIMVKTCLEAAELLEKDGIKAKVVDIVTIKPLDTTTILKSAEETDLIVVAENANVIGSLGSAIASYLSEVRPTHVVKVGVEDQFGRVGSEAFLRDFYGLTAENIVQKTKQALARKG